jgi:hypothetical protein
MNTIITTTISKTSHQQHLARDSFRHRRRQLP